MEIHAGDTKHLGGGGFGSRAAPMAMMTRSGGGGGQEELDLKPEDVQITCSIDAKFETYGLRKEQ